ncbi:DUF1007 family protein [Veronia pacifica]|uniref:ABC transporter substrate-binding protein n=1 Tax=Veronia pacifica TaxID=1080227 RepID=A0A1C3E959_9GAMM|nr:DUF1007 family protein [Veronia pacifica]ODA29808.1 hypothetical protein A8L45_21645 [Veronia pacifica]
MFKLMNRTNLFLKSGWVFLILICVSPTSQAHPHNWIDLNTSFVLDDQGRLAQVKQRWDFDVYFSMMTLADIVTEYGSKEEGLPKMATEIISNLSKFDYFSVLRVGDQTVVLPMPQRYSLISKKKKGQPVLELQMTFDLKGAVDIKKKPVSWQVFDPSYYIAMNHMTADNIEIVGARTAQCTSSLKSPEPSDELAKYALSLDRTQKSTDGLGENFAETAYINCY